MTVQQPYCWKMDIINGGHCRVNFKSLDVKWCLVIIYQVMLIHAFVLVNSEKAALQCPACKMMVMKSHFPLLLWPIKVINEIGIKVNKQLLSEQCNYLASGLSQTLGGNRSAKMKQHSRMVFRW